MGSNPDGCWAFFFYFLSLKGVHIKSYLMNSKMCWLWQKKFNKDIIGRKSLIIKLYGTKFAWLHFIDEISSEVISTFCDEFVSLFSQENQQGGEMGPSGKIFLSVFSHRRHFFLSLKKHSSKSRCFSINFNRWRLTAN